ncbi:von willebrand domain-containing protein [Moniliophthora roreri MCA 2997]|uniref:von willebrand domain-containing protein n=2 Tax=Moniliophthora roreri TaxID=221103 RepID=V2X1C7_MONRO|nr:von willebrand domain-containing protein [Moniliophthora roreri MCA 2997]KAI3615486.1 von willebrand domain-containing protein [Moniliophthora roreri]
MNTRSGIIHNAGSPGNNLYLPLEEVRVEVFIVDVSARVTVTQVFSNPNDHPTGRAVYFFSVPASASICAFEMQTSDDRVIRAKCVHKDIAREKYEAALSQGMEASLLEWVTDDVFTISLGSVPARESVRTKLVYVMDLMNEDVDEIRFQLPMHVGERYGELPPQLVGANMPSTTTRVRITADIQTSGTIHSIISPSHLQDISIKAYSTHLDRPSRRRSRVRFRSKEYLNRDFILVVHAEKLDAPRCFAELEGDPNHKATLAIQFTLVPKFNLPPIQSQEYVFVIDRSGSMQGERTEQAKRTLAMLIRMLPTDQTMFNIFSFGHDFHSLWNQSVPYTQQTLDHATSHIDSMEANLGGTKILAALNAAIHSRRGTVPAAVFVLTDGQVWDDQAMANDIIAAVATISANTPAAQLRIHVLGIGDGVSTVMCQDIATAGNGECRFATTAEDIVVQCVHLLRAGRSPFVKDVTIDWGVPPEYLATNGSSVNFETTSSSRTVRIRDSPVLQQAPTKIAKINAGARMVVFAILTLKRMAVPKEVTLRGQLEGTNLPFAIDVPIRGVQLKDSEPGLPMIHVLAAWRLIGEHMKGFAPLPTPVDLINPPAPEELRKAAIVRLGEKYQVSSRYTSFVAADEVGRDDGRRTRYAADFGNWDRGGTSLGQGQVQGPSGRVSPGASSVMSWTEVAAPSVSEAIPGAWSRSYSASAELDGDADEGYESARTFTTMSSLDCSSSSSEWSDWSDSPSPISDDDDRLQRSSSPKLVPIRLAPPHEQIRLQTVLHAHAPPLSAPPPRIGSDIFRLVTLQFFNGCYPLSPALRSLVGAQACDEIANLSVNPEVWATALAVAYITKHLPSRELSREISAKSREYLQGIMNGEQLIRRAMDLLD